MEITYDMLDLAYYEKHKIKPVTMIERKPAEIWISRDASIITEETKESILWGLSKNGDHIAIPLFPYLVKGTDPAVAMAFAFELGLRVLNELHKTHNVVRVHITIGNPVQEVTQPESGEQLLRFWLGCAFQLKV